MAIEIIFPRVDMDMESGKITQWFVAEGEAVTKGQLLFEIETDKAAMEIEATANGVVRGVTGHPGDTLAVGAVVGWIYGVDEAYLQAAPAGVAQKAVDAVPAAAMPKAEAAATVASGAPGAASTELRATPKARHLAHLAGVEIGGIVGSGPHGRVQARDVETSVPPAAVSVGLLHCEWLARGEGTPIVFVHGFGADLNSWRPLLGYFPPGRGALGIDLPGHGQSLLGDQLSLEALAGALAATLAAQGVGAAHLVGHSLGAAVATAYAALWPAKVLSLTLLSPGGLGPQINGAFVTGFLAAQSEASLAPWVRLLATDEAALGTAMVKTTLRQRSSLGIGEAQAKLAAALFPDGTQAFDTRTALAKYPGPVKIIVGTDDRIIPAHHARGLPGHVAVHLFSGIGHMPHFEARAAVALLVQDNVAAGERRRG